MTLRSDIEKDRALRKMRKSTREYKAVGLRAVEVKGTRVIYCETCKGPVVNSPRARAIHADAKPKCSKAMGID